MQTDNKIDRAAQVGIGQVRSWLPDGRIEGNEWIASNPNRFGSDGSGAFKVNLITGKWADFAIDDAKGNDAVSLFAYLHYDRLEQVARSKNYKNIFGGVQVEAAKEILLTYDANYFPSDSDDFNFKKREKGTNYWDGWSIVETGIDNPPELNTDFFTEKWGQEKSRWQFIKKSKIIMYAVRFVKNDKKEDRPFTLWTNGTEYKWRAKAPDSKYPLWNLDVLEQNTNNPVLLSEGQKVASIVEKILTDWSVVGFYGGAGNVYKTDWSTLRGREVWYPFDGDLPGRKSLAKIREVAKEFDIKLHAVHPPIGSAKGWDIADGIEDEGWDKEKIEDFLNNTPEVLADEKRFLDDGDGAFNFKILGYSGEHIVFYPYGSKKVVRHKATGLTKAVMMTLMDRAEWGEMYQKDDGGIAWDSATNDLLRRAEDKPVFDPQRVRGAGCWSDNGQIVVNTGEKLIINGVTKELYESEGFFVYEKAKESPYNKEAPLIVSESSKLLDILNCIEWRHEMYPAALAGWILLAPFGGALRWRPHIWLTGAKGDGKSWTLENIVFPMVGDEFGIKGFGTSTPAGVRDNLGNSSLCTILDEMESDNIKYKETIDQILKMLREAASGSGNGAATLHGTQDGEGKRWIVQTMAMCASIGAAITHGADKDRFLVMRMGKSGARENIKSREERFKELSKKVEIINKTWSRAFVSRTYSIIDQVMIAVEVMTKQATDILGSRRDGDQIGTLMAGAWMVEHDTAPTAAEAHVYLNNYKIETGRNSSENKSDEEQCLDELLNAKIEVPENMTKLKVSIGSALLYWYRSVIEQSTDEIHEMPELKLAPMKNELEQCGIKVNNYGKILIACAHPSIKKLLNNTPWGIIYSDMLSRLPFCSEASKTPIRFSGIAKKYHEIDAKDLFDTVPF